MAYAKLIAFDRPLTGAAVPGRTSRLHTEAEVAARTQAAYREGIDAARAAADQQMVEFRADMVALRCAAAWLSSSSSSSCPATSGSWMTGSGVVPIAARRHETTAGVELASA